VELTGTAGIKLSAHLRGHCGGDELARLRMVVETFEQPVHPQWNFRAAHGREFSCLGNVRNWQNAGYDFSVDSRSRNSIAEPEKGFRREEELRDCPVGAGIDLRFQIFQICFDIRRIRMALGIGGDRDFKWRYGLYRAFVARGSFRCATLPHSMAASIWASVNSTMDILPSGQQRYLPLKDHPHREADLSAGHTFSPD